MNTKLCKARDRVSIFLGLSVLIFSLAGCGPAAPKPTPASESQEAVATTSPGAAQPAKAQPGNAQPERVLDSATVVFVTGTVSYTFNGATVGVEIGDEIPVGAVVTTGTESACDLQLGSLATLRIEAETTASLSEIAVGETRRAATARLVSGSVAAKVSKLAGRDRFNVATQQTVCGVRGTEFVVNVSSSGTTKVSVREGSVALLPPSFDPVPIETKAAGKAMVPVVDAVFASMLTFAPHVEALQETTIGRQDLAKATTAWEGIASAIDNAIVAAPVAAQAETPQASAAPQSSQPATESAAPTTGLAGAQANAPTTAPLAETSALLATPEMKSSFAAFEGASTPLGKKARAITKATAGELATFSTMTIYQVPEADAAPQVSNTPASKRPTIAAPSPAGATSPARPSAPILIPLSIVCTPADAEIVLDGSSLGRGSISILEAQGSKLHLLVRRQGYEDAVLEIKVESPSGERRTIALVSKASSAAPAAPASVTQPSSAAANPAPRAIFARFASGATRPVGSSVPLDDGALFVDAKGELFRVTTTGLSWKAATGNSLADNALPFVSNGIAYVEGDKNLTLVDLSSGAVAATVALDESDSGLFGRRPAAIGNELFLSASDGLRVLQADSGASIRTIAMSEGSDMTPLASGKSLLIVDRKGDFLELDPGTGARILSVQSKAIQPVAVSAVVADGRAYFADRKGLVSCVDLASGTLLWSKSAFGGGKAVFDDLLVADGAIWCYSKGTIAALSAVSGESVGTTITGASAPPLFAEGLVWCPMGTGVLAGRDPSTGKIEKSLDAKERFAARPAESGGLFICPLDTGDVAVLDPAAAN